MPRSSNARAPRPWWSISGPRGAALAVRSHRCSRALRPRARARSCWRRSTPTQTRASLRRLGSRASRRSRHFATARWWPSSSGRSREPPWRASSTKSPRARPSCSPQRATSSRCAALWSSNRRAPMRRSRWRGSWPRGASSRRPSRVLEPVAGDFQVDGLRARLRLAAAGRCADALAALDAGDDERAFDLLLEALPDEDVRMVIVGELDRRGAQDPLVRATRRRLAAALY